MSDYKRAVYILVYQDGSVYVGSSYHCVNRNGQHTRKENQCVTKNKNMSFKMYVVSEYMDALRAYKREYSFYKKLKRRGITLLNNPNCFNQKPANNKFKWSLEKTINDLKRYETSKEVQKSNVSLHSAMIRHRVEEDIFPLCYRKKKVKQLRVDNRTKQLNKQWLIDNQYKYKNRRDVKNKHERLYILALKNNWFDDIENFKDKKKQRGKVKKNRVVKRRYYNLYDCYVLMRKCKTSTEFKKLSESAYKLARDNGLFNLNIIEVIKFDNKLKWTEETVRELAKTLKNKNEMKKKYNTAYKKMMYFGWSFEFNQTPPPL